ncbi:hypothetical protein KQX54_004333 [Cotesia glomerata]|uniref:Uncharacterized protein n=1 Tax=Cotesia glomerata TaxID=32391 RepID=A0AAV7J4P5_COTGL|nr:hypothetical protein KQX54_004333 [Cotesia glomerata]
MSSPGNSPGDRKFIPRATDPPHPLHLLSLSFSLLPGCTSRWEATAVGAYTPMNSRLLNKDETRPEYRIPTNDLNKRLFGCPHSRLINGTVRNISDRVVVSSSNKMAFTTLLQRLRDLMKKRARMVDACGPTEPNPWGFPGSAPSVRG